MSDSTPIFTMLSEICACAVPAPSNTPASAAATALNLKDFMLCILQCDGVPARFGRTPGFERCACSSSLPLHAEVLVQLRHAGIELRVGDHVDDLAMLHDVVAVRE